MLVVTYKVNDISSPTKIYNLSSVKSGLKRVFIDKKEYTVSSLTATYQFEEPGLHTIKYFYKNSTELPQNAFSGCTNIEYVTNYVNFHPGAFAYTGNGNGILKVFKNVRAVGVRTWNYKKIIINGNASTYYSIVTISAPEIIKITGNLYLDSTGYGVNYCYGDPSKLKFLEIGGKINQYNTSFKLFKGNSQTHLGNGLVLHLCSSEIANTAECCCASYSRVSKIYVGPGNSQEEDQAILDKYLADESWATYTNKLDLWYNYNGPYKK